MVTFSIEISEIWEIEKVGLPIIVNSDIIITPQKEKILNCDTKNILIEPVCMNGATSKIQIKNERFSFIQSAIAEDSWCIYDMSIWVCDQYQILSAYISYIKELKRSTNQVHQSIAGKMLEN